MRDQAKRAVELSMGSAIGPYSSTPRLTVEGLMDAYIGAIDEFISGALLLSNSPDERRETFDRLYHMIDMIPAWYNEENSDKPFDPNNKTKRLFDGET